MEGRQRVGSAVDIPAPVPIVAESKKLRKEID
jgi:hypothetical protein